jgi:hypothetical protein
MIHEAKHLTSLLAQRRESFDVPAFGAEYDSRPKKGENAWPRTHSE